MHKLSFVIAVLLALGTPSPGSAQPGVPAEQAHDLRNSICPMIEAAAQTNQLPVDFFARVIWQESRFQPDVIGPMTSSGEHAQGIAQFMPGTAAERHLLEPFNPVEALPKSGEFLAELRDEFGNLGLAAAAYNAGPQRVRDFLAGSRGLPFETRNYVLAITGHPIEDWVKPAQAISDAGEERALQKDRVTTSCRDLVALLRKTSVIAQSQQQLNVPSWCRHLNHPSISVCGSVHEREPAIRTSSLGKSTRRLVPILRASSR